MKQVTTNFLETLAHRCKPYRGFTVIELVVAMVITTICLLGVYSMLQRALEVDRDLTAHALARAKAKAVVDEVADALENMAFPDQNEKLIGAKNNDNQCTVTFVLGAPARARQPAERRRYTWNEVPETSTGGEKNIRVNLQRRAMAGTKDIAPLGPSSNGDMWDGIEPVLIASSLGSFSIRGRELNSNKNWDENFSFDAGRGVLQVSAAVDGQLIQRVVIPHVNAIMH